MVHWTICGSLLRRVGTDHTPAAAGLGLPPTEPHHCVRYASLCGFPIKLLQKEPAPPHSPRVKEFGMIFYV